MNAEHRLPFPALVGLDTAQQALLLLAVEPRLRGLVLAASAGSGKSSLARGLPVLLGDATPFVELPLGADEDSLLGGMDLEATPSGRVGATPGRAGAGPRRRDSMSTGLNLLPNSSADPLLAALDIGELHIEREGTSLCLPARFSLLASYDPAEGPPRQHLLDRVGLLAVLPRAASPAERAEVVRRNLALADDRRPTTDDRPLKIAVERIEDRGSPRGGRSILDPRSSILYPRPAPAVGRRAGSAARRGAGRSRAAAACARSPMGEIEQLLAAALLRRAGPPRRFVRRAGPPAPPPRSRSATRCRGRGSGRGHAPGDPAARDAGAFGTDDRRPTTDDRPARDRRGETGGGRAEAGGKYGGPSFAAQANDRGAGGEYGGLSVAARSGGGDS